MYYLSAPEIKTLLKETEYVKVLSDVKHNLYGQAVFSMPTQETRILYRGEAGCFLLHCEFWCGLTPKERVLKLPADLNLDDCLAYESEHKKDYSPWFKMVEEADS